MRGLSRLRRIYQRVRRIGYPTAVILLYHRVAELERDPQWLAVSPRNFSDHLGVLAGWGDVVPIGDLNRQLATRRAGSRPLVAISFDDGYADNLEQAAPLLITRGVPATVFATTGFVDGTREFFWDDLERLLLSNHVTLPESLVLPLGCGQTCIQLDDDGKGIGPADWNATRAPVTNRQRLYLDLCARVAPLSHAQRCAVVDGIREQLGFQPEGRASHRVMTSGELRRLDATGVVTVGSHTRWHLRLSAHTTQIQCEEIMAARDFLANSLGRLVPHMAYPFGSPSDYDKSTGRLAQEAGFDVACSNHSDCVWKMSDPFALPRFLVRDWGASEFRSRLDAFMVG